MISYLQLQKESLEKIEGEKLLNSPKIFPIIEGYKFPT